MPALAGKLPISFDMMNIVNRAFTFARLAAGLTVILIFMAAMQESSGQEQYSYLALGDSYTIGEQVKPSENFPNQVIALLRKCGLNFEDPTIVAKTGWTTDELEAGIKKATLRSTYDFVTLLIGVNNQYRERAVEDYVPPFESLLKRSIRFAGGNPSHVIVVSIPDWGVTPFAEGWDRAKVARQIDAFNAANRVIAEKYKVHYLDITPGTREAAHRPELLAPDGLHPSGQEYGRWAGAIADIMRSYF